MYNELVYFLSIPTVEQRKAFRRKANQVTGNVTIYEDVTPIIEPLKNTYNLRQPKEFAQGEYILYIIFYKEEMLCSMNLFILLV
ncbi:hypothetical protein HMPREF3093_05155 [Abiotrophia sp. HMSC24B09]|nr:hypothetical protein HMPREF3093_05155 [Abiotrophia sp. HMSC24B09]